MKQVRRNFFISYLIADQVWWCNIKQFLSCSKIYSCKFMQANSWHKLFHFHLFFWIWKVWKGRGKITKIWIPRERKELFRWNGNVFHSFWRTIVWWKYKNLIKNRRRIYYDNWIAFCSFVFKTKLISLFSFHWKILKK